MCLCLLFTFYYNFGNLLFFATAACDLLSNGATILLSSTNCQNSLQIYSMAASHHVTSIYLGQEPCSPDWDTPVVLAEEVTNRTNTSIPPPQYWLTTYLTSSRINHVVRDLVRDQSKSEPKWRDAVVFYDKQHGKFSISGCSPCVMYCKDGISIPKQCQILNIFKLPLVFFNSKRYIPKLGRCENFSRRMFPSLIFYLRQLEC